MGVEFTSLSYCWAAPLEGDLDRELILTGKFRFPADDGIQGSLARWSPPKREAEDMKSAKLQSLRGRVANRGRSTQAGRVSTLLPDPS